MKIHFLVDNFVCRTINSKSIMPSEVIDRGWILHFEHKTLARSITLIILLIMYDNRLRQKIKYLPFITRI